MNNNIDDILDEDLCDLEIIGYWLKSKGYYICCRNSILSNFGDEWIVEINEITEGGAMVHCCTSANLFDAVRACIRKAVKYDSIMV